MNADRLLAHYERIADAPDAIPRLRRFILDLAVRGKLADQDPNDEPATELLERIAAAKVQLLEAGEIRKRKPVARIERFEQPFALPSGWTLTKLAFVTECLDHMRKPVNGTERKERIAGKSRLELFPYFGATQQQGWIDDYIFDEELILLGEDGVPFFDPLRAKAYLISGKSWVNNHAHVFRGILVSHSFLVHYLNVFDYSGRVVGATRSKLNQSRALDIPIMLPPIAEQHRIVTKVDELMALCDQLDTARTARETTRDRLAAASLARLNEPDPDPEVFQNHTAFALDNLGPLTIRPDHIKAVRQTILNLAVRGRLVEQDPNDEPASILLGRIRTARAEQKRETADARISTAPDGNGENLPFELPSGWCAQSFENLFLFIDYRGRTPPKTDNGITLITAKNVRMGRLDREPREYVSKATFRAWMTRGFPRIGDLLFTTEAPLGNVCLNDIDEPFALAQRVICMQPYAEIDTRFLMYGLMSNSMLLLIHEHATGLTAKGIKAAKLKPLPIPVPPLAEQRRIASKVDELMTLCDRLEASLVAGNDTRCRLLDAVLHDALSPS